MTYLPRRSGLLRFGAVGTVGFAVDAGLLILFAKVVGIAALPARILSFLLAAAATFVLNWKFTFGRSDAFRFEHLLRYWLLTAVGACINIGIYRLWLHSTDTSPINLVVGVALGSLTAMSLNYFISSHFVFNDRVTPR